MDGKSFQDGEEVSTEVIPKEEHEEKILTLKKKELEARQKLLNIKEEKIPENQVSSFST